MTDSRTFTVTRLIHAARANLWRSWTEPALICRWTFADEDDGTRYTATVRHWTVEDRDAHTTMGFEAGWGIATDQLTALAATL